MKFKVIKTSMGYLAQGYGEFECIIIEDKTKKELRKSLVSALCCYFESFPKSIELEEIKK